MKKYLWMAALASVALASCVNEEVAEIAQVSQKKKLSFGAPVMYNQSRGNGEITTTVYPTDENFVVFGIEHDGNFQGWNANNVKKNNNNDDFFPAATGVEVANRNGTNYWDTPTSYYLPSEETHKLSFIAYSPARAKKSYINSDNSTNPSSTSVTMGATGLTISNWRMQDNPSMQYDLMTSEITANVIQPEIPIKFYHRLASINFQFSKPTTTDAPNSVIIKKLEIIGGTNFINMATYQDVLSGGSNVHATPLWNTKLSNVVPGSYVLFEGNKEVLKSDVTPHANVSGTFLPIPQNVTSDMKVKITYDIQQDENGNIDQNVSREIAFTEFIKPDNSITNEWEIATRYIYHIHFGALTKIFFAPVIGENWETVDNAGVYTVKRTTTNP